jgi:hypothetical protein
MSLGKIAFLGSGETSRAGGTILERLAEDLPHPMRVAVLETPAGFELNSQQVAGRVVDFMRARLQNRMPRVEAIPARERGTSFSPDNPDILRFLLEANLIFMGPGSPTYAIRQLRDSLAWDLVRARHRLGAGLLFSSSATIAVGAWGLPVYEIYKVGQEIQSVPGLNLFGDFGLHLSFIPHWNNTEGGEDVDTSRCFVGKQRFDIWCNSLPPENATLGLDEHTWLIIDFESGVCEVGGAGSVSLVRGPDSKTYPAGARFGLSQLGTLKAPDPLDQGISADAWAMIRTAEAPGQVLPPQEVVLLAERRQEARCRSDWSESDALRQQLAALGWQVQDTKDGYKLTTA